jgi:hypothetical protein
MDRFTTGAAIIVLLFGLNAVVHLVRARRGGSTVRPRTPLLKRPVRGLELALDLAAMLCWGAGLLAMHLAPGSDWGKAMAKPWALASLYVWLMAAALLVRIACVIVRARQGRRAFDGG